MLSERPWLKFYGDIPHSINYPQVTMYEALMYSVERYPDALAYDFLGYTSTYRHLGEEIDQCAAALFTLGMREGDQITIAMPTSP